MRFKPTPSLPHCLIIWKTNKTKKTKSLFKGIPPPTMIFNSPKTKNMFSGFTVLNYKQGWTGSASFFFFFLFFGLSQSDGRVKVKDLKVIKHSCSLIPKKQKTKSNNVLLWYLFFFFFSFFPLTSFLHGFVK